MTQAYAMKVEGSVAELSENDLLDAGIDASPIDFDRPVKAGETVFDMDYGSDAAVDRKFSGIGTGTDMTLVQIYKTDTGQPVVMPRDWAIARLKKTWNKGHPLAGKKVFSPKQLKVPAVATIPCPSTRAPGCRKMLFNGQQAFEHFKMKHKAEWEQTEAQRTRDMQERGIRAQELQTEAMTKMLAQMAAGPNPTPEFNVDSLNRSQLVKLAIDNNLVSNPVATSSDLLREAIRAAMAEGDPDAAA